MMEKNEMRSEVIRIRAVEDERVEVLREGAKSKLYMRSPR
jgi:hypothetical protein